MANTITIAIDTGSVDRFLDASPGRIQRAIARSINRAIGAARTVMVRAAAADMGLKAKDVRVRTFLHQANPSQLVGDLSASHKAIPLILFHARGPEPSRGRGAGVTVFEGGATRLVPNAFIATMPTGHRGVFIRLSKKRFPIKEKFGHSVNTVFAKFLPLGIARAQEALDTNLDHELGLVCADVEVSTSITINESDDVAA